MGSKVTQAGYHLGREPGNKGNTYEQMAAFMHRLAVNRVVDAGTVQGMSAADLEGVPGPVGPAGADGDTITLYKVEASTIAGTTRWWVPTENVRTHLRCVPGSSGPSPL